MQINKDFQFLLSRRLYTSLQQTSLHSHLESFCSTLSYKTDTDLPYQMRYEPQNKSISRGYLKKLLQL